MAVGVWFQTFKLGIYFRQYWRDPRLSFNSTLKQIVLSQDLLEALWLPDSFFQTETESYIHEVTKPNVFFRLHDDGYILMSTRCTHFTNSINKPIHFLIGHEKARTNFCAPKAIDVCEQTANFDNVKMNLIL